MRRLFIMHDGRFFRKHRSQLELRCRVWELPLPPELPDLARWQRRRRDIDDGVGDPDIAGRPVFHRCIRPGPEVASTVVTLKMMILVTVMMVLVMATLAMWDLWGLRDLWDLWGLWDLCGLWDLWPRSARRAKSRGSLSARVAAVCAVPPLAPVEASGPGGRGLGANGVIGGDFAYAGRAAAMP